MKARSQAAILAAPAMAILAGVAVLPVLAVIWLSLHRSILVFHEERFIGIANFRFLVTDGTAGRLYGNSKVLAPLDGRVTIMPGEQSKTVAHAEIVWSELARGSMTRSDIVVALGGGVVGDLAGFAAAILRRGVDFVQVPTSLLAQVDSSVGGKTGINSPQGKNLLGAFHQPVLVIADTAVLDTLSPRQFRSGYAEVAKYGVLGDEAFFSWLEKNHGEVFRGGAARERAIATSCRAKAAIVARDERETGDRALLNLGHTFGHAFEAAAGFSDRLLHGEAIALGMSLAFDFSAARGLLPQADAERVKRHLGKVGLPTHISQVPGGVPGVDALMDLMAQDKKVRRGRLTFILVRGIGQAFVAPDVDAAEVRAFLARKLAP